MRINSKSKAACLLFPKFYWVMGLMLFLNAAAFSQPANDNCTNASIVTISNSGFGIGVFTSTTDDLTLATVQAGETFAPAILVAGQNQKSVWYKFTLPTTRSVRVTLAQPGSLITAGDVGFAVYKTNACLPTGADISTKITPIGLFGNSFHPCVESGNYLVQVSGKAAANGPVYITIETGMPTATFDLPVQAYNFGTLPRGTLAQPDFNIDCQSIDDGNEICNTLYNYQDYNKSTWHVFKTPAYLDYLSVVLYTVPVSKVGYKIYQGDVRSTPYSSLPVVAGCDSFVTSATATTSKIFGCNELNPNTTYSIQLFYHKDFYGLVALRLSLEGSAPTIAPEPLLSAITPTTNNMGVLASSPTGIGTATNDVFACNARHSLHPCEPSMPAAGVINNGKRYNLSSFFLFTLSGTSTINITVQGAYGSPGGICGPPYYVRLYKQNVSNSCNSLDTANIIGSFITNAFFTCLPPGNYTLQVMGQDTTDYAYPWCQKSNLGSGINVNINVQSVVASNKFSLSSPGAFDTLNNVGGVMQPLVPNITYVSQVDTFGCANTVLPTDICNPGYQKAIYREFIVPDSGIVSLRSSGSGNFAYRLYKGDANALAIAQNTFSYPGIINGLVPQTQCLDNTGGLPYVCDNTKVCVEPGTYTEVVVGAQSVNQIGQTNQFQARFNVVNTVHHNLATAEDMGDILSFIPSTGGSITSSIDYFSCKDNAIVIDGFQPCKDPYGAITSTKAIYRQFYLSSAASITINSQGVNCGVAPLTLFRGKATDGLAGLTVMPAPWRCFDNVGVSTCTPLSAGWYTVVSYGWGPSYQNPTRDVNSLVNGWAQYGGWIGYGNKIQITYTPSTCPAPKYNRPNKAAIDTITNQPFLIQWGPRVGSTAAYPRTDTTYNLYTENFLCPDTPFAAHPVLPCNTVDPSFNKVAYYVFQTTQESFLRITSTDYWITAYGGTWAFRMSVYAGNVRTTPNLLTTTSPIQPCIMQSMGGQIQLCNVQPGYYTIVIYAHYSVSCQSVTPSIYIDKTGYSRFDHANNAYDFGLIPSDSTWYNGKPGDVNPLDPGRAPSNDIFYCTTGSRPDDPAYGCWSAYIPSIYNTSVNNPLFPSNYLGGTFGNTPFHPRRNLWYTFVVDKGGWVRVKVKNKTTGKTSQYPYFVFKSDVNGTLPFSTVVSMGSVDSTSAQGLSGVAGNAGSGQTCQGGEEVSFYREACSPIAERYYIIVQNPTDADFLPNHQVEVSVLFDSVNAILPKFDHYYQADNIGVNLGPGTYNGQQDNISCATRDATDPSWPVVACGDKTIWYKFSTTVSGYVKMRMYNSVLGYFDAGITKIQLFRQLIPGDSTSNGLQFISTSFVNYGGGVYYDQACISPGTYYIILPNCYISSGYEYPEILLEETFGDYCTRPVIANLNGAGTSVTSVLVNCHTIGTDYGEFNPTLTCPAGAVTNQYKTSWFKINITGSDTLDVTTFLTENTNASSSQIKYRLMNGDCNAMQERSCVQDALTQDTYKCLAPGEYWIQVFTPVIVGGNQVTGTIDLHLSAVNHVDTCAPINTCLSNANFQKQFDCNTSSAVRFINYSTFGSSISYLWDFGYAGQTSTAVSPTFTYPALTTAQTYTITLTVTNNTCGGVSTYTDNITIPPRPGVNLGADTSLCNGGSIVLNATSHSGATYLWSNGSTNPTITVTATGQNNYWVAVTYNGCVARDTIRVNIDPIIPQTQNLYICGANATTLNSSRGLGESHNWSTGATSPSINVFLPGTYWNNITLNGCITRDSFIVSTTASTLGNDRAACFASQPVVLNATTAGATGYTWQNGTTAATFNATTPGIYWVDVAFGNCTLRDSITLSSIQSIFNSINASICQGQTYTLPSGIIVNTAGVYSDTTRTAQGCDSLINTVSLSIQPVISTNSAVSICNGQSYTLPWGTVVNSTGIYRDTLRYASGCDSLHRIVNLVVQQPSSTIINAGICSGQTYTLPSGVVVSAAGIYADTLYYSSGCDSLYRTVNLSIQTAQVDSSNATICSGQTYSLPWGTAVSSSGIYRDTLRYVFGCDSVYRIINLNVQIPQSQNLNITICNGQSYTLPSGVVVMTTGIYKDTLYYSSGCDSLRSTINLLVQSTQQIVTNDTICAGQSYTLPWSAVVSSSGTYIDTLRYVSTGCDSLYTIVNLVVQSSALTITSNATICAGQSFTLPWGNIVSTSGIYTDTILYTGSGCDSLYRVVDLIVQPVQSLIINAGICSGQTYTLPWGPVVTVPGIYKDTLFYTTGCDSLYRTVNLSIQNPQSQILNPVICAGQSYTLPAGTVVNSSGVYNDTLYFISGCDSLYSTVNLTVQTPLQINLNDTICAGQAYILPWGAVVNNAGTYRDTIRYMATGCDSLYTIVDLFVLSSATTTTTNATICSGQSYTLPWGTVVSASGIYSDTIRYISSGCDSLYNIVNLIVQTTQIAITNASICSGQNYTLPSGVVVNTSGVYRDTLSYSITGCDSLYRIVNLSIQSTATVIVNPTICAGQTYTLPSGITISTAGVYNDTARYTTGCDSLYTTINLTILPVSTLLFNPTICTGQTYTTPWGSIVSSTGIYRDTLRYTNGCDSIYRIVDLIVQNSSTIVLNPAICTGQTYTLPWGAIANTTGVYRDTLRYASGCDSLYRVINLTVQSATTINLNPVICSGQIYTLPWGSIVSTTGTYRDTLKYSITNCDSLYRIVNLTVQPSTAIILNPIICAGQTYTLPWGVTVNTSGVYKDTLRYSNTNCDSLYRTVNLIIQSLSTTILNQIICAGQTYTLPWGVTVNTSGVYKDTLYYFNTGCDSLYRTVNLVVQTVQTRPVINIIICQGQTYTLPWGAIVNATGVYRDTLRYINTGCDSLRRTINLTVQAATTSTNNPVICQGQPYTLPWGVVTNVAGTYKDTLRYVATNCDSLYRIINLSVIPAATSSSNATICQGEVYLLPWGINATVSGIYRDTLRSVTGCDSLVRTVNLTVKPKPTISLSKSNDINCIVGSAKLNVGGAVSYVWSPAGTLSNPTISNPLATPTATTFYTVLATGNNGCVATDSIRVIVDNSNTDISFQLPSAFTPNGDGKNDCFGVRTWGSISNLKLQIYNRWGELVFATTDPNHCWDGTFKGVMQSTAVFVYQVTAETICGKLYRKGTVTLLR